MAAYPSTPLPVTVELNLAGTWTDITSYVYTRAPITINRGRADESTAVEPSLCAFTVNNRDGRFSPRNPRGPYYGIIGRNTPVRVSVSLGTRRLAGSSSTTAPDTAGLSIVGDLDMRVDLSMPGWAPNTVLLSKYSVAAGQRSYRIYMAGDGTLNITWSADGSTALSAGSTLPVPHLVGRQAVRATLDVDNGAAGRTITFYTAPTLAGPWVQLGVPVVQAGVTSIFDSTTVLQVNCGAAWSVYGAEVYQGIAGTVRANPDFTAQTEGATTFTDAAGNAWTIGAGGSATNRRYRFNGEVSTWPVGWGVDGKDIWVGVTASGIMRRLGQGASPIRSALRRGTASLANLVAYWPMEDVAGASQAASAVASATAMAFAGVPQFATNSSFPGSDALPALGGAAFTGYVPAAAAGSIQAGVIYAVPAAGDVTNSTIMRMFTTGTVVSWALLYTTAAGGTISFVGYNAVGAAVVGPIAVASTVNGRTMAAIVDLRTSGANVAYDFYTLDIVTGDPFQTTGTVVTASVGCATAVLLNVGGSLATTALGHPYVLSSNTDGATNAVYVLAYHAGGYVPETAGRRIQRLCTEQGVPYTVYGYPGPTLTWLTPPSSLAGFQGMGPQANLTLLDALRLAADADLGVVFETREALGLAYRPREASYNQAAALALDYSALSQLDPVDDDQGTRNDVTVARTGGSSARATLTTGALSVQAPPAGVGTYDEQVEINLQLDSALVDQASWRLRMGTVDESRYPVIRLDLSAPVFTASSALTTSAMDMDVSDLLTVVNPPAWLPPDLIRQLAQGFTETLGVFDYDIEVTCTPASVWDVGIYDETTATTSARYSSDGSTLAAGYTSSATSFSVATPSGPIWTTTDVPFSIVVAGEQITVTAVSGAATPQTFTVTRAVNGTSKAQLSGAAVALFKPAYYAM